MKLEESQARLKSGRNDPCPCGSGKKYKKCHRAEDEGVVHAELKRLADEAKAAAEAAEAEAEAEGGDDAKDPKDSGKRGTGKRARQKSGKNDRAQGTPAKNLPRRSAV